VPFQITDTSTGSLIDSTPVIAEEFNKYFVSVFNVEDKQNVPQPSINISERTINLLSDVTFMEDDVKKKFMKVWADKAPGADDISPRLLCNLTDEISEPLWLLFWKSLGEGLVPEDWKKASVSPIYKNAIMLARVELNIIDLLV